MEHHSTEVQRRDLVEHRILQAMEEGAFDNLPGAGKPLNLDDATPGHEGLWWALRLLKNAGFVTDEVRYRRNIDSLRERLAAAASETEIRTLITEINDWILKLNTMGTNVIPTTLAPIDEATEVERFRSRCASRAK